MKKDSTLYIAGANYFTVGGTVTTADGVTFETDENGKPYIMGDSHTEQHDRTYK